MRLTLDRVSVITELYKLFEEVNSNIYHERAPQGSSLPYAVYNVGSAFYNEGTGTTFNLEINVWDNKGTNITELEQLTNDIAEFFNDRTCNNGTFAIWFNQPEILPIPDPDENIRRRQINFNCEYNNV